MSHLCNKTGSAGSTIYSLLFQGKQQRMKQNMDLKKRSSQTKEVQQLHLVH